jgi:uncharacterized protein (TIGR00369 family)
MMKVERLVGSDEAATPQGVTQDVAWDFRKRSLARQRAAAYSRRPDEEDDVNQQSGGVGVVPRDVLMAQDGLSFLRAIVEGRLPAPPIAETLDFTLAEVEYGRAVFAGVPAFKHYNPIGVVHGGYAATLLDSALGCAVHSTLLQGEGYTTLELKLNLVRAITKDTGRITAEGRLLHRGRTVGTAEGYLRDGEGKLYAHATTTCMIFPAKGA